MSGKPRKTRGTTALTKRDLAVSIQAIPALEHVDLADVQAIVQATLDGIIDALDNGKHVEFREFGVFEVTTRQPRIGRNPNKPEDVVVIPKRSVVKFKPGKRMREMMAARQ